MARTVGTLSGTLGIDFGTSNSAVSWAPPGQTARLLALEGESTTLPTAIFFDDEEHSTHFGREAMARYLAHHEGRLMRSLKSLLGSALLREQTVVHGKPQSYQDIVSGFLQELVRRAQAQLGGLPARLVLGRPVHFVDDDPARDAQAQESLRLAASACGGLLMGFGGVLAAGCSIGQGLTGLSTLAWASFPAALGIAMGGWAALRLRPRP